MQFTAPLIAEPELVGANASHGDYHKMTNAIERNNEMRSEDNYHNSTHQPFNIHI